ncbi:MAG: magnesium/cobalt transporter CorA [Deltaproteobacteria bacterium]|nr:magnesium/cobalt transporter CorA [Deltaproteobacteria bacterium]
MVVVYVYSKKEAKVLKSNLEQCGAYLNDKNYLVWIDFLKPSQEEKNLLINKFKFHPTALEDCFSERFFPKITDYKDYLYVRVHGLKMEDRGVLEEDSIRTVSLSSFICENMLVTYHENPLLSIRELQEKILEVVAPMAVDTEYLFHHILDEVVDQYIPVLDKIDKRLDRIENKIFTHGEENIMDDIFSLKKRLMRLRRIFFYQKEVIHKMYQEKYDRICAGCSLYFKNVYDHMDRVLDQTEFYRDMTTGILDVSLSIATKKLTEIMNTLTLFAAVLLPLTVIVGIYGMNFKKMPLLHSDWGFPSVMFFMAFVASILLYYFKRKKWL